MPLSTGHGLDRRTGADKCVVGVNWLSSVAIEEEKWFSGAFGNQDIACRLRDAGTVEFLQELFRASNHEA